MKKYFAEASDEQIESFFEELAKEIEVMVHAKIRKLSGSERTKNIRILSHSQVHFYNIVTKRRFLGGDVFVY